MEESTRISVTWLELFLDLSVVVAIQKTTSDMEEHLTLLNSVEYAMRMLCIWLAWNLLSLKCVTTTVALVRLSSFFFFLFSFFNHAFHLSYDCDNTV